MVGFPCDSAGKESICNVGDLGLIHGLGRAPGEGTAYPLPSGMENYMDCIVHGVTKSWTRLSNFHFPFFIELELISSVVLISDVCLYIYIYIYVYVYTCISQLFCL